MTKTLIPIFADQLSFDLSALSISDRENCILLMMEVRDEANSVWHHRKKLVFLFSAMRHFAAELRQQGWTVDYVKLNATGNTGNFYQEIERALKRHDIERIRVTEPSEYRVLQDVKSWSAHFNLPVNLMRDDRFLTSKEEFVDWARGRKSLRMEYFYREVRKKYDLLMDGNQPIGGKWNYDSDNRKSPTANMIPSKPIRFNPDAMTQDVIDMVTTEFSDRFGDIDGFFYGVNRQDALRALDYFIDEALPKFGDYQDAMMTGEPFLYHSLLSAYLNVGLLLPLEICRAVEAAYVEGHAPINAVEGFIRQIIGWREYVRGIYWYKMPDYLEENVLNATRDLPEFYWTGETDMHCLSQALGQTKQHAYAHHIQRLMITGNFALLIGVDTKQLHEWYLAVYIDAFEWVELPNTLGMSQFADGGLLASKPYASSGAYINRMSDYCKSCRYNVKDRIGENACPYNSLYWHFMDRNRDILESNPRIGFAYKNLDKMDETVRTDLMQKAQSVLENLS